MPSLVAVERIVSLLMVGLLLSGCFDADPHRARILRPFSGPETAVPQFEDRELLRPQAIVDLSPRRLDDLAGFRFDPAPVEVEPDSLEGLVLRFATPRVAIRFPPVPGAETLEVVLGGTRARPLELRWPSASGDVARLEVDPELLEGRTYRYRFALRRDAEWRQRTGPPTLEIPLPAAELALGRLLAVAEEIDPNAATGALDRPVRFDPGGDERRALVVLSGRSTRAEATLPEHAVLRTALAAPSWSEPARFRLVIEGEPTPRFARVLDPSTSPAWTEVKVDLSDLAGQRRTLRLEVQAASGLATPSAGIWAEPTIVGGRDPARPSVLLISVDTLRADRLSLYGHTRPTSPRLDRWAEGRARVFEGSVAASPWTLPSHLSLLTGLPPHRHGVNLAHQTLPSTTPTLAEAFLRAGYRTAAFTGGAYVHPRSGMSRGFESFRHWSRWEPGDADRELETLAGEATEWLGTLGGAPFFLFFHTYEVHGPPRARQPYYRRFGGRLDPGEIRWETLPRSADGDWERRAVPRWSDPGPRSPPTTEDLSPFYDSSVAFADHWLGQLLEFLETSGRADDTVVLLTSDHGEMLGERGLVNHFYLEPENLEVPFVLAGPGVEPGRDRRPTHTVDAAATLLDLAGLDPLPGIDGRSVASAENAPPATGGWSFAASTNHGLLFRRGLDGVIARTNPWAGPTLFRPWATTPPSRSTSLAPVLARRFLSEVAAPILSFRNGSESELHGALLGDPVDFNSLAAVDLTCRCLRLEERFVATFRMPPDTEFSVALLRPERLLTIRFPGELDAPETARFALHLTDGPPYESLRRSRSGTWERLGDRLGHADGIQLRRGPGRALVRPENGSRERGLRALGYLD